MKTRFVTPLFLLGMSAVMQAQTPGRLVFTQLGLETLSANGNTVQMFQTGKTGSSATPTLLSTFPTTSATGIVFSGTATSENNLGRSPSGRYLYVSGYAGPTGSSTRSGGTAATVNRIIGRYNFLGQIDLSTRLNNAHSANNIRGAVFSDEPIDGNYRVWTSGANEGVRTATLGATSSSLVSVTGTNLRHADIVNGDLIFSSGSTNGGVVGLRRLVGTPTTSGNTLTDLLNTNTGSPALGSPIGFCFQGNAGAGGSLTLYVSDDSSGVVKYTSTDGLVGPFTRQYQVSATAIRHMSTDGQVLYGVTAGSNNNSVVGIVDGGSLAASLTQTVVPAVGGTNWIKGVQLAPEPIIVDSSYTSAGTAGSIMTLRQGNNAQRSLRVVLVPDSASRSATNLVTGGIPYSGQAVKTATDSTGATYVAIQTVVNASGVLTPAVEVRKVPAGGGTPISSTLQNIPVGYEAFAVSVDSTNRPVVAYRPGPGTSDVANVRFVRWSADLGTATLFDNSSAGFSSGAKVPVDFSIDPSATDYGRVLFATGSTLSTTAFTNTFSAGTATADLAVANDGSVAIEPLSAKIGDDGSFRVLSAGTGANRALFRVDTLNAGSTGVTITGRAYRRDGIAPNETYTQNTATSPAFMWALGLSMGGNNPKVALTSTSELTTGPNAGTPREDVILGSGRVWNLGTDNRVTSATYRFAPKFSPVN